MKGAAQCRHSHTAAGCAPHGVPPHHQSCRLRGRAGRTSRRRAAGGAAAPAVPGQSRLQHPCRQAPPWRTRLAFHPARQLQAPWEGRVVCDPFAPAPLCNAIRRPIPLSNARNAIWGGGRLDGQAGQPAHLRRRRGTGPAGRLHACRASIHQLHATGNGGRCRAASINATQHGAPCPANVGSPVAAELTQMHSGANAPARPPLARRRLQGGNCRLRSAGSCKGPPLARAPCGMPQASRLSHWAFICITALIPTLHVYGAQVGLMVAITAFQYLRRRGPWQHVGVSAVAARLC